MKFRKPQHNVKLLIVSLSFSFLTACGGGGGGSDPEPIIVSSTSSIVVSSVSSSSSQSSTSSSVSSSRSSSRLSSSAAPPVLSGEALSYASEGELADSDEMPAPTASVTDTLIHDRSAESDASVGIFKYGKTYVISFGGGVSDCPSSGQITCPYFERVKISADGNHVTSKFAYYPIQKKWVSLSVSQLKPDVVFADSIFDGAKWLSMTPALVPKTPTQAVGPWSYGFGAGIEYQLSLESSSLSGEAISGSQGITYPSNAKSISLSLEQTSGILYALSEGGFWRRSDDGAVYPNTASLRAAHSSIDSPLCSRP